MSNARVAAWLLVRWVDHAGRQAVVALAEQHDGHEAGTVEHCVGGLLRERVARLDPGRQAELVEMGIDGGEQLRDAAAEVRMGTVLCRVIDHQRPAGRQPALGAPWIVVGRRLLRRRDDEGDAVRQFGDDDVVAEAVLDRGLQTAPLEWSGDVAVSVLRSGGIGSGAWGCLYGGAGGDPHSFPLNGDLGLFGVHEKPHQSAATSHGSRHS
ncbi:hypothetical protein [Streptomyces sp. CL12]|uniref:hypothetical protein n=1 Tax=Streptomyces sp. CL12 TaxID=3391744 RepID=UPI003A81181C